MRRDREKLRSRIAVESDNQFVRWEIHDVVVGAERNLAFVCLGQTNKFREHANGRAEVSGSGRISTVGAVEVVGDDPVSEHVERGDVLSNALQHKVDGFEPVRRLSHQLGDQTIPAVVLSQIVQEQVGASVRGRTILCSGWPLGQGRARTPQVVSDSGRPVTRFPRGELGQALVQPAFFVGVRRPMHGVLQLVRQHRQIGGGTHRKGGRNVDRFPFVTVRLNLGRIGVGA